MPPLDAVKTIVIVVVPLGSTIAPEALPLAAVGVTVALVVPINMVSCTVTVESKAGFNCPTESVKALKVGCVWADMSWQALLLLQSPIPRRKYPFTSRTARRMTVAYRLDHRGPAGTEAAETVD